MTVTFLFTGSLSGVGVSLAAEGEMDLLDSGFEVSRAVEAPVQILPNADALENTKNKKRFKNA
jgi:hypothetical protein